MSRRKEQRMLREGDAERNDARRLRRNALAISGGTLLVIGGFAFFSGHDDRPPVRRVQELAIVALPPPPPPPPPPPEQKMIEQQRMDQPEFQEEKPIDDPVRESIKDAKTDEPPPGPLALDAKATGPGDGFGLGGKPGGSPYGGGGGGSRFGRYTSMAQTQIESALRANRRTRKAAMRVGIRLWIDGSGRVTQVALASSTGDAELDAAIRNEVLGGLVLREPPPKDMPMPMVTRVTARRPG